MPIKRNDYRISGVMQLLASLFQGHHIKGTREIISKSDHLK
ncbi:MAG: hypothetical protein ACFFB5_07420 [Promethearchaeota archaeon]